MKKYLLISLVLLLFTGCSYDNKEQNLVDKKEYDLSEKHDIELRNELQRDKDMYELPWKTKYNGQTMAEQLDENRKMTEEHLEYAYNYLKTNNVNESEKQEINEDIEFSKEFLQKVIYLRTFYNDNGTKKSDKEYFEYVAKNNHKSEIIKERLSEINNIVKDFNVQAERGMALADYIEIGTRRQNGRGNSTKEVLEKNKKDMSARLKNMTDEADNNDQKLKNWDNY